MMFAFARRQATSLAEGALFSCIAQQAASAPANTAFSISSTLIPSSRKPSKTAASTPTRS